MPKIIKNLRSGILNEARAVIDQEGFEKLNLRYLSKRLGIAPSTIYNYYTSKDQLLGELATECWNDAFARVREAGSGEDLSVISELDLITEELRKSVKPLLLAHVASSDFVPPQDEHSRSYFAILTAQLEQKVCELISGRDLPYSSDIIKSDASVLTKLIAACMHDDSLHLRDIATVFGKAYFSDV